MKTLLTHRLSQSEIMQLCALTQGEHNDNLKEELYQLTLDANRRVATNALWVFTHFAVADSEWLYAKHDQLIDRCLKEHDTTKLRLILSILLRQPFVHVKTAYCFHRLAYLGLNFFPKINIICDLEHVDARF